MNSEPAQFSYAYICIQQYERFHLYCVLFSDVNECDQNLDRCDGNCTDTNGSYVCSCPAGLRLHSNGYSCIGEQSSSIITKENDDYTLS